MSLLALGVGPGDEVITTTMTFIATSTAIVETGATPDFVDVEAENGLIDPNCVEAAITPRTKAILPVHLYGQMCDMRASRAIADKHELAIVEDCAHCIEGVRDDVKPGQRRRYRLLLLLCDEEYDLRGRGRWSSMIRPCVRS